MTQGLLDGCELAQIGSQNHQIFRLVPLLKQVPRDAHDHPALVHVDLGARPHGAVVVSLLELVVVDEQNVRGQAADVVPPLHTRVVLQLRVGRLAHDGADLGPHAVLDLEHLHGKPSLQGQSLEQALVEVDPVARLLAQPVALQLRTQLLVVANQYQPFDTRLQGGEDVGLQDLPGLFDDDGGGPDCREQFVVLGRRSGRAADDRGGLQDIHLGRFLSQLIHALHRREVRGHRTGELRPTGLGRLVLPVPQLRPALGLGQKPHRALVSIARTLRAPTPPLPQVLCSRRSGATSTRSYRAASFFVFGLFLRRWQR